MDDAKPTSKEKLQSNLAWRSDALARAYQWHAHLTNEMTTWGIETMKHIALIALAGLAGVFALMSSSNNYSRAAAVTAAALFAITSGLCVAGLYAAYLDRCFCQRHQIKYIEKLHRNEVTTSEDYARPRLAVIFGWSADGLGWLSAIFVLFGGISLFQALP